MSCGGEPSVVEVALVNEYASTFRVQLCGECAHTLQELLGSSAALRKEGVRA